MSADGLTITFTAAVQVPVAAVVPTVDKDYLTQIASLRLDTPGTITPATGNPPPETQIGGLNYRVPLDRAAGDPPASNRARTAAIRVFGPAQGPTTEVWVALDPRILAGEGFEITQKAFPNEGTPEAFRYRFRTSEGDPAGYRTAELSVFYGAVPANPADPGPIPTNHETRLFNLYVRKFASDGTVEETLAGFMHQDIFPIGSLNRIEHWYLSPDYVFPSGGRLDPNHADRDSIRTVLVSPVLMNPTSDGPAVDRRSVAQLLLDYQAQPGQGSLVQVRQVGSNDPGYTWVPL